MLYWHVNPYLTRLLLSCQVQAPPLLGPLFHAVSWCVWQESNLHAFRHWFLKPACLPFHHTRRMGCTDGLEPSSVETQSTILPLNYVHTWSGYEDLNPELLVGSQPRYRLRHTRYCSYFTVDMITSIPNPSVLIAQTFLGSNPSFLHSSNLG